MVVGIDDISAIASLVAISVSLLNGCIKGFAILCRAQMYDQQISSIRLLLELEQHKVFTWAEEVGLLDDPPQLRVKMSDVELVNAILEKLGDLLKDVQKLRTKYGLSIETTAKEIIDITDDGPLIPLQVSPPQNSEKWQRATVKAFSNRTQPWQRLKWVAWDEKHFRGLLGDISRFTSELQRFLDNGMREDVQNRHDTLLRNAIVSTTSQLALNLISHQSYSLSASGAVSATARLKRKRLFLDLVDRFRQSRTESSKGRISPSFEMHPFEPHNVPQISSKKLSARLLTLINIPRPLEYRQLAYYENTPVLLEWRTVHPTTWNKIQSRVEKLSNLLFYLDDPSFHSLRCRGYVRNHDAGRYGFVFDLPNLTQTAHLSKPALLPHMQTLRASLDQNQKVPSLNLRISYAIVVVETILQIHTAGWLHKELRSNNIIFLDNDPSVPSNMPNPASNMYIVGYVYARPDDPQEYTEPAQEDIEAQFYRHPRSLGSVRSQYRKAYDIFSVGCILLELGLWSSLSKVLTELATANRPMTFPKQKERGIARQQEPSLRLESQEAAGSTQTSSSGIDLMSLRQVWLKDIEASQNICGKMVELLEAQTGRQYAQIVGHCLRAGHVVGTTVSSSDVTEDQYALDLEERSLKILRDLAEKL